MPIEFGAACYRFGHSMVRPVLPRELHHRHRRQPSPTADPFFGLVFDADRAADFNAPLEL